MNCISILFIIASVQSIAQAAELSNRCPTVHLKNGGFRIRGRGRIVRFRCFDGYTLVGNRYSTCKNGQWDAPTPVCVNSQCPELPKPDHSMVAPKYDGAVLMYFCEPGYRLIGSSEIYCDGRQWNGTSPYCRNTSEVAPTSCDFEKPDLCWWEQDPKHDFDWRRHNFETPSSHIGTGPTYDHTLGRGNSGYYLYIEASGRLINDTARVVSPIYNSTLTHSGCFSFWYHMYGDTIGALRVYFKPEESTPRLMFNKEGNQGNQWLKGMFSLPKVDSNFQIYTPPSIIGTNPAENSYTGTSEDPGHIARYDPAHEPAQDPVQIVIEGVRGKNYVSDIAVDDVAILQGNECIEKNNTSVTVSDDDQAEIFNAAQSCQGRCINANWEKSNSDALSDACHCTLDCAENSTCCPDYGEYCILDAPSEMTDAVDTTTPMLTTKSLQTTRDEETRPTEIMLLSTKIIESSTSPSVTQNISQSKTTIGPPKVEIVTTPSTVVIRNTTLRSTVTGVLVTTVRTKAPFITIDDVDTLKHDYNETQDIPVTSENSEYLHPDTAAFGLTGRVGALIGILAAVSICVVATLFILRSRKAYKRGTNGLSEDSDVRFLTSDEILDFNVARPANDYNDL